MRVLGLPLLFYDYEPTDYLVASSSPAEPASFRSLLPSLRRATVLASRRLREKRRQGSREGGRLSANPGGLQWSRLLQSSGAPEHAVGILANGVSRLAYGNIPTLVYLDRRWREFEGSSLATSKHTP